MNSTLRKRALKMTLKIGLGGIALALWQAPAAKAQECGPDSYTAAETAKMENLGKKPVNILAKNGKQSTTVLVAKNYAGAGSGTNGTNKSKSARLVAAKQPVKTDD